MDSVFFKQICSKAETAGKIYETSIFLHLEACECVGTNFGGMPDIDFELLTNGYNTDSYYAMDPLDYELYPKIDSLVAEEYCNNGFWNLHDSFPENTSKLKMKR